MIIHLLLLVYKQACVLIAKSEKLLKLLLSTLGENKVTMQRSCCELLAYCTSCC